MLITSDQIIKRAQKCLKEGRNAAAAYTALGMAFFEKDLLDKAAFHYGKAVELDPAYAPAYAGMGIVYGKKGLITESIFNLKEAIRLEPDCALLYNWLGDAYFDQGRIDDAIREYTRAIEGNPHDSNAHNDLADAFRLKGDYDQARRHYDATLAIDPGDTNALLELAQVLIRLGQKQDAINRLNDLIRDYPDSDDARTAKVVLASLATQDGDLSTARAYLEQATRDYPFNPTIQFHLGLCHLLLEDLEPAKDHLQRALDLDPTNVRAQRLLQQIDRGRRRHSA